MPDETEHLTLSESAARQLANATKTRAQWRGITPRWLISFLNWTPVEAGIFRLNRVREEGEPTDVEASPPRDANPDLPETYVDYVHDSTRILSQGRDDRPRRADAGLRSL
jgi:hypothetical protein